MSTCSKYFQLCDSEKSRERKRFISIAVKITVQLKLEKQEKISISFSFAVAIQEEHRALYHKFWWRRPRRGGQAFQRKQIERTQKPGEAEACRKIDRNQDAQLEAAETERVTFVSILALPNQIS